MSLAGCRDENSKKKLVSQLLKREELKTEDATQLFLHADREVLRGAEERLKALTPHLNGVAIAHLLQAFARCSDMAQKRSLLGEELRSRPDADGRAGNNNRPGLSSFTGTTKNNNQSKESLAAVDMRLFGFFKPIILAKLPEIDHHSLAMLINAYGRLTINDEEVLRALLDRGLQQLKGDKVDHIAVASFLNAQVCCNKVKPSSCKRRMIHAKFMRIRL